jgi:hypothetical protein
MLIKVMTYTRSAQIRYIFNSESVPEDDPRGMEHVGLIYKYCNVKPLEYKALLGQTLYLSLQGFHIHHCHCSVQSKQWYIYAKLQGAT